VSPLLAPSTASVAGPVVVDPVPLLTPRRGRALPARGLADVLVVFFPGFPAVVLDLFILATAS
jgi:hypothetical protein